MTRWLRYPINLLFHGRFVDCEHSRRQLVKGYFSECFDCGALFDDGRYSTKAELEAAPPKYPAQR